MSSTVSMRCRARMVERVFLDPPPDLPTLWIALTWDVPAANDFGFLGEPLLGAYARVAYPLGTTHWAGTGYGEVINTQLAHFPMATLDWGYLQGWALVDSSSLGNGDTYAVGSLQTPIYVAAGIQPTIAEGGMSVGIYD